MTLRRERRTGKIVLAAFACFLLVLAGGFGWTEYSKRRSETLVEMTVTPLPDGSYCLGRCGATIQDRNQWWNPAYSWLKVPPERWHFGRRWYPIRDLMGRPI
jgi:hypothetical protein